MLQYARAIAAALGPDLAGLAARVQYAVYDLSGAAVLGPTGDGVWEAAAQPGLYLAAPLLDRRWCGRLEWTVSGLPGVGAADDFGRVLGGYGAAVVSLGPDNSGQAANLGLTVCDRAGGVLAPRSAAGIAESAALPGVYWAPLFLAASWAGYLQWDLAGRDGAAALEEFGPGTAGVPFAPVQTAERPYAPR